MLLQTRRQLLRCGLVAAVLSIAKVHSQSSKAPRRRQLSFGLRSSEMRVVDVESDTTYLLTAPFETNATAVRIGLGNILPSSYHLDGICFAECEFAESWSASKWAYFSFPDAIASDEDVAPASTPQKITVPGNRISFTGATNVPTIYWSNWMKYKTSVNSNRPQMLFRALVPPQRLPLTFPDGPGDFRKFVPESAPRQIAQMEIQGDYVTTPLLPPKNARDSAYCPIFVIQYRTGTEGIQIVAGGDSHLNSWHTFFEQAAVGLSVPSLPISVWNTAWGGQSSNTFWPILDQAIDFCSPSISVIQGWTANDGVRAVDGTRAAVDQAYLVRVKESAERTMRLGGTPIILKGMPTKYLRRSGALASWLTVNQQLDNLVPGAIVFDPNPYVEASDQKGSWRFGFSDDAVHPNLAGNTELRAPFEGLLQSLM